MLDFFSARSISILKKKWKKILKKIGHVGFLQELEINAARHPRTRIITIINLIKFTVVFFKILLGHAGFLQEARDPVPSLFPVRQFG